MRKVNYVLKKMIVPPSAEASTSRYVSEALRIEVFRRDGYRCVNCNYEGEYLEVDHAIPDGLGGPSVLENLQSLCGKCNGRKGMRIWFGRTLKNQEKIKYGDSARMIYERVGLIRDGFKI